MTGKSFSVWLNNEYIPNNPDKAWIKEVYSKNKKCKECWKLLLTYIDNRYIIKLRYIDNRYIYCKMSFISQGEC